MPGSQVGKTHPPSPSSVGEKVLAAGLLVGLLAGLCVVYAFNPENGPGIYPPCLFHRFTGLFCPGCGATRCLYHLTHLNLWAAWRYNPFTVVALPYIGAHFLLFQIRVWTGRRLSLPFAHPLVIWAIFAGIMGFWIARNLPWYPFFLLAPNGGG